MLCSAGWLEFVMRLGDNFLGRYQLVATNNTFLLYYIGGTA